ncbi:hypothetical protein SVAN01_08656 [Stagonosporopsis vannaccii]|nr:hypothetical protein SVAN01_08656 [Stagonosporopsis vannaccii]
MGLRNTDRPLPRTTLFPHLPLELRELIYHYAVPLPSSDVHPPRLCISAADVICGSNPHYPTWLPPIAHVSAETRIDVALYIIRRVEVYVPYHQTLRHLNRFLITLPSTQGQSAIRRLNFPSFGATRLVKGWETVFIDFAKSCPQLAMLQIGINAPDMKKLCGRLPQSSTSYGNTMLKAESIAEMYGLNELTGLNDLVRISFELCPLFNGKPVEGCVAEVWKAAALVAHMFADHEKTVDVLVVDFRGKQWSKDA